MAKKAGKAIGIPMELAALLGVSAKPVAKRKKSKKPLPGPAMWLQLKISLKESNPLIWRRVEVPDTLTLDELHIAIQIAMGWETCHLYGFTIREIEYSPEPMSADGRLSDITLRELKLLPQTEFEYIYDYGDSWQHEVEVEHVESAEDSELVPRYLGGESPCPPEDCGGIWGYENLCQVMQNPKHPEYESMKEWIGDWPLPEPHAVEIDDALWYQFAPQHRRKPKGR